MGGSPLTDADCELCHEMSRHQVGQVRLWADPNAPSAVIAVGGDPTTNAAEADRLLPFCKACHNGGHVQEHNVSGDWQPACTACHDLHDPQNANLSLVSRQIRNHTLDQDKSVVFTARTGAGSFDDRDDAVNDGVCQVCHVATAYHRHDGSGETHFAGEDCTACHPHASGFSPSEDSACTACHNTVQGPRRAVVGEFALASHHAQSITNEDCIVCHEMSEHKSGHVRLRNPDDPENAAAVVALVGDPLSDADQAATLAPFCLACHDGEGAGSSAPFSDGIIPPAIDVDLWSSSSHGITQTCFGDGATFGCHGTGHGSVKRGLLAPWDASQTAVAGDPLREEEGFCYTCHDADGPASTDVKSQFALTSRHHVSAADQADGSRVECSDCHNPHTAGTGDLLADPDSGGSWTGKTEAFCLTCHDGDPPPSVAYPATAEGTGFDKSAFPGSKHSDHLGGESCGFCHEPHGASFASLLKARYVVQDYNTYTSGDGDYAACWLCHDEQRTIQQQNAFRDRHDKHVRDKKAPCIICHDVHGGFDADEPGLINLDYSVRSGYAVEFIASADGSSSFWIDVPENKGNCLLKCHGEDHEPEDYDRGPSETCAACHAPHP